ncbi:multiple ankyrin repeats single kh domain protein [Penicillium sp. IBT 35674x]|nr:multiple ankyrin repeats single kh domain protein [Penicillium sp. IBT 35674x]
MPTKWDGFVRWGWNIPRQWKCWNEEHDRLPVLPGDDHVYNLGSINGQNIVIVGLPRVGNNYAATAVAQMRNDIPVPPIRFSRGHLG